MFYQPCLRSNEFFRETILVPSLRQNFSLSTFKIYKCCKIGSRVVDSWYYVEKYQRKRDADYCYRDIGRLTFSRKTFANVPKLDASK